MPENQSENNPNRNKFITSWSGGKDSCYALHLVKQSGLNPVALFTMLSDDGEHTSAHGLNKTVIQAQASAMGLPILLRSAGWGEYESQLKSVIAESQNQFQASTAVFGDIDLEAHKVWIERVTHEAGIQAELPLWLKEREALLEDMLRFGIKTMIVSIKPERLPEHLLGQVMTPKLAREIKDLGVCPSGEDGEFHSLVVDAPLFSKPLNIKTGSTKLIGHGYTALDVSVV